MIQKSAIFSDCGKYRNQLTRSWDGTKPSVLCIGLNPSTANAEKDDNTIRILIAALEANGFGKLVMMNLYALISSKPEALFNCADPQNGNDICLHNEALKCDVVVYCWGNFKGIDYRVKKVRELLSFAEPALCFGKNQNGSPWHPRALTYAGIKPSEAKLKTYC